MEDHGDSCFHCSYRQAARFVDPVSTSWDMPSTDICGGESEECGGKPKGNNEESVTPSASGNDGREDL